MPPMTMVFRVSDPRLLEGLAVGQRIGFTAERINGQFTVTSVTKGP
jgi:Cu/Ag efflux protein CusF